MPTENTSKAMLVANCVVSHEQGIPLPSSPEWYPDTDYEKGDQVFLFDGFRALCQKDHLSEKDGLDWKKEMQFHNIYDICGTQAEHWMLVPAGVVPQCLILDYNFSKENSNDVTIQIRLDTDSVWNRMFHLGATMILDIYEEGLPSVQNERRPLISVEKAVVSSIRGSIKGFDNKNDYDDIWDSPIRVIGFKTGDPFILSINRESLQERY